VVTLGDGKKPAFWQSSWLHGKAPIDLFPELYKLAWRKKGKLADELSNGG